MTTFSTDAWARNAALYAKTRDNPFNRELGAGTLSSDRFRHYVVQDAHYLVAFGQALAMAAAKADDPNLVAEFASAAQGAISVERGLHAILIRQLGLSTEAFSSTPVSPACHHYAAFLLATALREPLPVVAAALLPCFWVYREIGTHILRTAKANNPFQSWIDTYGGDEFAVLVDRMIAITDNLGREGGAGVVAAMHRAYTRAAQLEWMFWDSAYRLEDWPV